MLTSEESAIAFLRYKQAVSVYRMSKWDWVLDRHKWNDAWAKIGVAKSDRSARFGIAVLDTETIDDFIARAAPFLIDTRSLATELETRLARTSSWWDVEELFPKLLIDFDQRRLTACYDSDGNPRWEEYVPEGWMGEFADFTRPPNSCGLDAKLLYWIIDGRNILDHVQV